MTKYSLDVHRRLRGHATHSVALSLVAGALIELEESLAGNRDLNVMVEIQALADCMIAFGEMYGTQSIVAAYLAEYEKARAALGG